MPLLNRRGNDPAVAALVALATYNSADASLNTATGAEPTNLLGSFGAMAADIAVNRRATHDYHILDRFEADPPPRANGIGSRAPRSTAT